MICCLAILASRALISGTWGAELFGQAGWERRYFFPLLYIFEALSFYPWSPVVPFTTKPGFSKDVHPVDFVI